MSFSNLLPRTKHPKPRRKIERPPAKRKEVVGCIKCGSSCFIPKIRMCFGCLARSISLERAVNLYERQGRWE